MVAINQHNFGASDSNSDEALPHAVCNCLLIEDNEKLVLIDSGLGELEIDTLHLLSQRIPAIYDIPINPNLAATRQLSCLGYGRDRVTDIVLTHLDLDHAGGLKDFPAAHVHLSKEEHSNRQDSRYLQDQFSHRPHWEPVSYFDERWFNFAAKTLLILDEVDIKLIPLPGHTLGHCGVAVRDRRLSAKWIFHVGDAYYHRSELHYPNSNASFVSRLSAFDDSVRQETLSKLRYLAEIRWKEVSMISSHDASENIQETTEPHQYSRRELEATIPCLNGK